MTCIVGRDGLVKSIVVKKGHPLLIKAATDAVSQWKFKPLLLNGEAVEVETAVAIDFRLPKGQKTASDTIIALSLRRPTTAARTGRRSTLSSRSAGVSEAEPTGAYRAQKNVDVPCNLVVWSAGTGINGAERRTGTPTSLLSPADEGRDSRKWFLA